MKKSTMLMGSSWARSGQIVTTGRYLERFFVNEMPLGSCLPTLALALQLDHIYKGV